MHGDGAEGQTVARRTIFRNRFDFCVEDASYDLPVNFSDTVRLWNKIRVAAHSVCRKMLRRTWSI